MPTDYDALDAIYPIPAKELYNQWLLTRDADLPPEEWRRDSLYGWHLACHESTAVTSLLARDGERIGWVFSPLVYLNPNGGCQFPEEKLKLPLSSSATATEVERVLYGRDESGSSDGSGLAGMWIAVIFGGSESERFGRVYLSPANSVVFSRDRRVVATTPNLVPGMKRDLTLSRVIDPLDTNKFYTFGLTAFEGVRRLLPNHYLDLEDFEAHRHWPTARFEPLGSGETGAALIVDDGRRIVEALTERIESFHVFLSAGRDSRAVLAIARRLLELGKDVHTSTSYGDDIGTLTDLQAARRLAKIANLPHVASRRRDPPAGDRMLAFARIGEARAGSVLSWPSKQRDSDQEQRFKLGGMAGELGRAYYWGKNGQGQGRPTPTALAKRLSSSDEPSIVAAAASWLEGLPAYARENAADALDFAYLELRLGCWEAPVRYVSTTGGTPLSTSPMMSAFSIETMLRLPPAYRAAGVLQRDMVAYGWPELLTVPFNEPSGLLRFRNLGAKARGKLGRIARKRLGAR